MWPAATKSRAKVARHHAIRPARHQQDRPGAAVGADLAVMERDTRAMRGEGPFVFAQVKNGVGVDEIIHQIIHAWQHAASVATCSLID